MRRHGKPRHGDGTAWLVVDGIKRDYLCYWYTGSCDGHLVDHARATTAADAVAWGRRRTPRVRIRTADARTYWAGTTLRPDGFTLTWAEPDGSTVGHPLLSDQTRPLSRGPAGELGDRGTATPVPLRNEPTPAAKAREAAGAHAVSAGSPC